jgi:hypothetical protein
MARFARAVPARLVWTARPTRGSVRGAAVVRTSNLCRHPNQVPRATAPPAPRPHARADCCGADDGSAVRGQGERTAFSVCANESDPLGYASCQNGACPSRGDGMGAMRGRGMAGTRGGVGQCCW